MIGRELYTAPFVWVQANDTEIVRGNIGKFNCKDSFTVEKITYDAEGHIDGLAIVNRNNKRVFTKMPKK